jgi:hypothetical protein
MPTSSSCHAYLTATTYDNDITFVLNTYVYSGGVGFGAATPIGSSCATSSGNNYTCTIDGGVISAGSAIGFTITPTGSAIFTTAFSCQ